MKKYLRVGSFSFYVKGSSENTSEEGWTGKPGGTAWFAANNNITGTCLPVIMLLCRTKWENNFQKKHIKTFSSKESNSLVCLHVEAIMNAIKTEKAQTHT